MDSNTVITVVVPLHQDAKLLDDVIAELGRTLSSSYRFFEIVLVDDGSTDGTQAAVQAILVKIQRIRYLRLSRSFGRDVALSAGIESAIGDFVVTLDPRTDPVATIPAMIDACRKTGGVIHGVAANPLTRSAWRDWIGGLFRNYCRKHIGVDIKRGVSDFRVMSRQAVNALLQVREQSRYLRVLTLTLGYHHEFFPYELVAKPGSERTSPWREEVSTAIDLLAANTRHPLRLVTAAGLLGAIMNLFYAVYVVAIFLTKPSVAEGWTTLSLQLSGMFLFVCLILAVLSEYVGTILGEVRSRPLYFMAEEANSSVLLEDRVRSSVVKESGE
jgi:glycosyltransferase involved in cell wall biosynthesis